MCIMLKHHNVCSNNYNDSHLSFHLKLLNSDTSTQSSSKQNEKKKKHIHCKMCMYREVIKQQIKSKNKASIS